MSLPTLGEQIRNARMLLDIGLRELARRADISPTYLSRVETGEERRPPSEEALTRIAAALGHSPDGLLMAAGRIPEDVRQIVAGDMGLWGLLRAAAKRGIRSDDLWTAAHDLLVDHDQPCGLAEEVSRG